MAAFAASLEFLFKSSTIIPRSIMSCRPCRLVPIQTMYIIQSIRPSFNLPTYHDWMNVLV